MPQSIADEFKSIPMSSNLGESLERAHRFARDQTHRTVTLEHLLLALTEDPEAALILQAANIDLARLRTDVSGYLGRLQEDMRAAPGAEPHPDPELLRVLQAAASAAQQSKRKQIDGAIVLAAIVGDGKSPAAGTLKAHGMTFEEAIRALQRANTQARLKTPKPAAGQAAAKAPEAPQPKAPDPGPAQGYEPQGAEPASLSSRLAQGGTADDILAAARARIQQRSSLASRAAAAEPDEPPPSMAPAPEPDDPVEAILAPEPQQASNAFEELLAASTAGKTDAGPGSYPDGLPLRQGWAPPPETRPQPNGRHPQAPAGRPQRQAKPSQGARPGPTGAPAGAPGGYPNRPARAPWPEPGETTGPARPPGANGYAGGHHPDAPPQQQQRPAPAPRGGQGDRGPLVESVPRRMKVGVTSKAEVRIARDRIEGLVAALGGQGTHRGAIARALSVRLRAPKGGFWIEPVSPETQWVGGPGGGFTHDEYATWRWTVTPQRRGKAKLLLTVSARTIGQDGVAAESAPPDRLIEIRVAPNRMRKLGRLVLWLIVLGGGIALGRHTDKVAAAAMALLKKALEF